MSMAKLNDYKRNFFVLVIACILNFTFALEKFFIVINCPLPDLTWMVVYGGFSIILAVIAFYDYYHDVKEDHISTPNII